MKKTKTHSENIENINNEMISIVNEVKRKFGTEAIMLMNGDELNKDIKVVPSGSFVIDHILGIGGYPEGRVIEIYGPESSGKTTIALHAIAESQKKGGICAFIDAEHALDAQYAKNLGVDTSKLIVSQPDSGEQALEIVETLVKTNVVKVIVVDSVAALVPELELQGDMYDNSIGLQARMMSKALRKIVGAISKSNCVVIFINQLREKVGIKFGNPEITPGGRALKFYSSIRLEVRKIKKIGVGDDVQGNEIVVKVVKNKLAAPYKVGETKIIFSKGISREAEILQIAEEQGIVGKNGTYYTYDGKNIARGKTSAIQTLEDNPELLEKIELEVKQKLIKPVL